MRVVFTGNMGYVGPVVVRHFRARFPDAELIGFDAGYFAHCLTSTGPLPETSLDAQYFGDVRDFPAHLLTGANAVVHLAAVSNDPMGNQFGDATDAINRVATLRIAELAQKAGVGSFVFASSCSIYGFAEGGARTENDPVNPLTAYAKSKVGSEEGLRALSEARMAITCLRFATACGMSDRLRLDLVLNDFVAGAISSGEITVLSDGSPWRPLIDVSDMARAIEWAAGRSADQGGAFLTLNAGSDEWNFQVKELAKAVAAAIPGTRVSINSNAQPDKRSYRVDFSRYAALAPDHQPQLSLSESIERLVEGLRAIKFNDPEFRNSGLARLPVLRGFVDTARLGPELRWG